jgi:hypothetical protein
MIGKELNVIPEQETQEDVAKKVIEKLYYHRDKCKSNLELAEKHLNETLEKDVKDIKEKDGEYWDW